MIVMFYGKYKKISFDFKKLMSRMKNVSLGNVNNINGVVTKACDLIIVNFPNGMSYHGINKGQSIPSWMQLKADEWWKTLFDLLDSIFLSIGCTLITCNAKMARLQKKL